MPSALMQMDSILTEQLPALERKMISSATTAHAEPSNPRKKNFLSRLFSREKKRQEVNLSVQQSIRQTDNVRNIQKFGDEMYEMLERQNRLFESLADSLEHKNRVLNRNISRLVNELEKDAMERTAERHQRVSELREEAFRHNMYHIISSLIVRLVPIHIHKPRIYTENTAREKNLRTQTSITVKCWRYAKRLSSRSLMTFGDPECHPGKCRTGNGYQRQKTAKFLSEQHPELYWTYHAAGKQPSGPVTPE